MPVLHDSEPGDGLAGFPPILARTVELNEPRVPIGELGFTEGYALLDVGEDTQEEHFDACRAVYDDVYFTGVKVRLQAPGDTVVSGSVISTDSEHKGSADEVIE
jgi:hypothetical protein